MKPFRNVWYIKLNEMTLYVNHVFFLMIMWYKTCIEWYFYHMNCFKSLNISITSIFPTCWFKLLHIITDHSMNKTIPLISFIWRLNRGNFTLEKVIWLTLQKDKTVSVHAFACVHLHVCVCVRVCYWRIHWWNETWFIWRW